MGAREATGVIARQEWLQPIEEAAQHAIHTVFRSAGPTGQKVKNALHGTWLDHSLHADVPIGAWTAAMVFDAIDAVGDRREFRVAADSAMTSGIVGALGAAVAGLTDWQDTEPPARRIGLTHGLLNVGGVALFAGSLAARLGGNMVYEQGVGVDHTAGQSFPDDFLPVLAESELPEGSLRRVEYKRTPILLAQCPWHGSRFALEDGRVLDGPAVHRQPCLEARARNGRIEVRKAIGSRSVSGVASGPAMGEVLAPAEV